MKLLVEKLGRIKRAEIDVLPLTVFVGSNNTNKTWSAYSLYSLLNAACGSPGPFNSRYDYLELAKFAPDLKQRIEDRAHWAYDLLSKATPSESVTVELQREEVLSEMTFPIKAIIGEQGVASVLGVPPTVVVGASAELEFEESEFHSGYASVTITASVGPTPEGLAGQAGSTSLTFELVWRAVKGDESRNARRTLRNTTEVSIKNILVDTLAALVLPASRATVFPSERKGLTLNSEQAEPRRAVARSGDSTRIMGSVRYSRPVGDYLRFITNIGFTGWPDDHRTPLFKAELALIEERLLRGRVGLQGESIPKTISYTANGLVPIPVHGASSIVKSLAGLDIYLSLFARKGDVIIIDEPEMNAHPDGQLAIAEWLCMLVNKGLRLVITTHSPYISDHINNLVEAAKLPSDKQDAIVANLVLQDRNALIQVDDVSMYWFNADGEVRPLLDQASGQFDLSTFTTASDKLSNIYADILKAGREG